jgi:hypothetical protein
MARSYFLSKKGVGGGKIPYFLSTKGVGGGKVLLFIKKVCRGWQKSYFLSKKGVGCGKCLRYFFIKSYCEIDCYHQSQTFE